MIILKEYYENKLKNYYDSQKDIMHEELHDIIYNYGEQLEEQGWINDITEGGFISPNLSTIYYYSREPYIGQLIQFRSTPKSKEQYDEIIKSLAKDFIEI